MNHKNIVKLLELVEIDLECFATILELCDGLELTTYIKR